MTAPDLDRAARDVVTLLDDPTPCADLPGGPSARRPSRRVAALIVACGAGAAAVLVPHRSR